jgi:hypothetical protein
MSGADSVDFQSIFSQEILAANISNLWTQWKSARIDAEERWSETSAYKYATSTRETSNAGIGGVREEDSGWSHSTHIPKLTQIADNLGANYMSSMMPHDNWFNYVGEDESAVAKDKRAAIEGYLRTKHRLNGFRNKVQQWVDDWNEFGNCFAGVTYVREEHLGNQNYTGPVPFRISPRDIVFNPMASDFEHAPKIVRSMKTLGELQRDIEENPQLGYSQAAFDSAIKVRSQLRTANVDDFNKSVQMTFDGYGTASQYLTSGFVEVLEFYGDLYDINTKTFYKNQVITVIDRAFILRNEPLNTISGRPHIFHCGWRLRPDNLWAMGPLDNLVGMQYLINHLENARADMFDQMLAPTRVLVGNVETHGVETGYPGGHYEIPDGEGSVSNLLPDTTVLNADLQIQRKEEQMEQFVGAPREQLGIRTPGEKTLGEVNQLSAASSRVFQNKISYFEENFLEKILNAELEVSITYMDGNDTIKTIDSQTGVESFLSITSDDLAANGKLVPMGARHFNRVNQLAGQLQALEQALLQDPLMAQHFPSIKKGEFWTELLGIDSHDILVPFGRVGEQAELAKLTNAAEQQIAAEDGVAVGGPEDEEDFEDDEAVEPV